MLSADICAFLDISVVYVTESCRFNLRFCLNLHIMKPEETTVVIQHSVTLETHLNDTLFELGHLEFSALV